jgi:hypothetical protein
VAADDDHLGQVRGVHLADVCERVESVAVGQPDVQQNDVVRRVGEQGEGFCRGCGGGNEVALFAEDALQRVAAFGFIVNDENVVHRLGPRCEVRDSRCEIRGARFEVRGARFEVRL